MDRVLRAYAQTAFTPADPLAGLDLHQRRAILMMPSTFRERFKVAPWTSRDGRRAAIQQILAERRLAYDLYYKAHDDKPAQPVTPDTGVSPAETPSPYYQYRLSLHDAALKDMRTARQEQDIRDLTDQPEARLDTARRDAIRQQWLALQREREDLDRREERLLGNANHDDQTAAAPLAAQKAKPKRRDKDRSR